MKNPKVLWIIILLLLSAIGAGLYKFIIVGSTAMGEDGRTAVILTKAERNAVLEEMRMLLVTTQQITKGLAENDMEAVIAAATPVGSSAIATVDFALRAKLPIEFKKLGFGTHYAFDEIIAMAKAEKPASEIQLKLVDTMNNCVACHATFQLPEASE